MTQQGRALQFIMDLENGDVKDETVFIEGFQLLVDTGILWGLQGAYQRTATQLAREGKLRFERKRVDVQS